MKKTYFFLFLAFLLSLSVNSYSQTIAYTEPLQRNVVLEEYTGIHCGYCPEGHAIAKQIAEDNPGRVVLINIHAGNYAVPSTGEPDFRTPWGNAFVSMSGLSGYPSGNINRIVFPGKKGEAPYFPNTAGKIALSRNGWTAAADSILNGSISPVNIGLKTRWNKTTRDLEIIVELYFTSDMPGSSKLNVALLESHVWGPQSGGKPDATNYEHNHILRDLVTGQWGEPLAQYSKGQVITKTYTYHVDEKYIIENCDLAVFVTGTNNMNTYTGIGSPAITPSAALYVPGSVFRAQASGIPFDKTLRLVNISDNSITYQFSAEKSERTPEDWQAAILGGNNEITLNPSESHDISVSFVSGATPGIGDVMIRIVEKDKPSATVCESRMTLITENIRYVEVNSGGTVGNTSLKYARPGAASLTSGQYRSLQSVLGKVQIVLWNTGAKGALTTDDADLLSQLIDNKIGLIIGGSVPLPMLSFSSSTHRLFSQLGIIWHEGDDIQLNPFNLEGIPGDPVSDGFSASGTTDINGYFVQPMTITNPSLAVPMIKNSDEDKTVSVRIDNGDSRVIYLSFNPEIISDMDVRNNLIKKAIDWIDEKTGIDDDVNALNQSSRLEVGAMPNPVSGNSTVWYKNNSTTIRNITINLVNTFGQKTAHIWNGIAEPGINSISFDFSQYPQGSYFLSIGDGIDAPATFPICIVK